MDKIAGILSKTIALVGLALDPNADSYRVAEYLKSKGYRIIPVNPFANEILGEVAYKSLLDMPEDLKGNIEIVNIFRPSEEATSIIDETLIVRRRHGNPAVMWMQVGITNKKAAEKAEAAGLIVVMDKCMMIERERRVRMLRLPSKQGSVSFR